MQMPTPISAAVKLVMPLIESFLQVGCSEQQVNLHVKNTYYKEIALLSLGFFLFFDVAVSRAPRTTIEDWLPRSIKIIIIIYQRYGFLKNGSIEVSWARFPITAQLKLA